jgi:cbb3-type cytochrome oxidase cytochrome c subunit
MRTSPPLTYSLCPLTHALTQAAETALARFTAEDVVPSSEAAAAAARAAEAEAKLEAVMREAEKAICKERAAMAEVEATAAELSALREALDATTHERQVCNRPSIARFACVTHPVCSHVR